MHSALPDFRLEQYFATWEFHARHNLTASDAQTLTVSELLAMASDEDRAAFEHLPLGYVQTWGGQQLRQAVAATYERCGPEDVLTFAGAQEALFWAMQLLVEPGGHAIVTVPNYQSMETVPLAAGVEVTGLPLDEAAGWALDLDALRAAWRPSTALVAVNFPNNPTGAVPDPRIWADLVALCEDRGARLFSDEVYRGIERSPRTPLPQAADLSPTALSLNVLSKAYGLPGLRLGWLACRNHAVLERLERHKHYTTICNAAPSEFLGTVALRAGKRIRDRNRAIIEAKHPAVRRVLRGTFRPLPVDATGRWLRRISALCRRRRSNVPRTRRVRGRSTAAGEHLRVHSRAGVTAAFPDRCGAFRSGTGAGRVRPLPATRRAGTRLTYGRDDESVAVRHGNVPARCPRVVRTGARGTLPVAGLRMTNRR